MVESRMRDRSHDAFSPPGRRAICGCSLAKHPFFQDFLLVCIVRAFGRGKGAHLLIIFLLILAPTFCYSQGTAQDSVLQFLAKNQESIYQIVDGYKKASFNWAQMFATLAGFIFLTFLTWRLWFLDWLKSHIQKKALEAIDEINNLKTAKILVVSNGDDTFLKSFFKEKKFPNVKFIQMPSAYQPVSDFDYELVFGNNDNNALDKSALRKFVGEDELLFYFGKSGSWDFANDTQELSKKINFANSRAQIYGNLLSSLEFLALVNPKIKNV